MMGGSAYGGRVFNRASGVSKRAAPWLSLAALILCGSLLAPTRGEPIPIAVIERAEPIDYEREIAPLVRRSCLACHNRSRAESELVLESPESIAKGGATGPAIDLADPDASLLLLAASHRSESIMPPADNEVGAKPLSSEELGLLRKWIAEGAKGSARAGAATMDWQPLPDSLDAIYAVAVTSDGHFAFCNRGPRLHVYDLIARRFAGALVDPAPELQAVGAAHHDVCQAIAVSPDGRRLASGGYREIKFWEATPAAPQVMAELGGAVLAAARSDDASRLAIATEKSFVLLDVQSGAVLATVPIEACRLLAWSADGQRIAAAAHDSQVTVFSSDTLQPIARFDAPARLTALAFEPQPPQAIVTGDERGRLDRYSLEAAPQRELARHSKPFAAALYSPSGDARVLASHDGGLYLVDRASGRPLRRWLGHSGPVRSAAWLDDARLATLSADRTLRVWSRDRHSSLRGYALGNDEPTGLAIGGGKIWLARASGAAQGWNIDVLAGEAAGLAELPVPAVTVPIPAGARLLASPDGATVYAVSAAGALAAIDTASGQNRYAAELGVPVIESALSPDGAVLAICSGAPDSGGVVRLVQTADGSALAVEIPVSDPRSIAFVDADRLAIGAADGKVHIAERSTGQVVETLEAAASARAIAARDGEILIATADGAVGVRSTRWLNGQKAHTGAVTALQRLGSERLLSAAAGDTSFRIWGQALSAGEALPATVSPATALVVSADGKAALAAGDVAAIWRAGQSDWQSLGGDLHAQSRLRRESGIVRGALIRRDLAESERKSAEAEAAAARTAATAADEALAKADAEAKTAAANVAPAEAARDAAVAANKSADEAHARAAASQKSATERAAAAQVPAQAALAQIAAAQAAVDEGATAASRLAAARDRLRQSAAEGAPIVAELATHFDMALAAAQQSEAASRTALASSQGAAEPLTRALAEAKQALAEADATLAAAAEGFKTSQAALAQAEKAVADTATARDKASAAHRAAEEERTRKAGDLARAEEWLTTQTATASALQASAAEAEARLQKLQAELAARPVSAAALSADGANAAIADARGEIQLYAPGGAAYLGPRFDSPPKLLAWLDSDRLLAVLADGRVVVQPLSVTWRLAQARRTPWEASASEPLVDRVTALAWSPDGSRLASGSGEPSRSGELVVWDAAANQVKWRLPEAHSDTILALEFSPDGRYLATGSADKFAKVFDAETGELVRPFEGHTHHVLGVSWRADGVQLATAGADQVVKIWNFDSGEQIRTMGGYGKAVTGVRYVADASQTISGSGDAVLRLHNADDGKAARNYSGAKTYLSGLAISPDGRWFVAGGDDSVLRLWRLEESKVEAEFEPPSPESK